MRRMFLFCLMATFAVAGCQSGGRDEYVEYDEYDEYLAGLSCNSGASSCGSKYRFVSQPAPTKEIRFSTPRGNDLVLETPAYVLQVEGAPNKKYQYYVWAGDKKYSDDPDLIVDDGRAAVLVEK